MQIRFYSIIILIFITIITNTNAHIFSNDKINFSVSPKHAISSKVINSPNQKTKILDINISKALAWSKINIDIPATSEKGNVILLKIKLVSPKKIPFSIKISPYPAKNWTQSYNIKRRLIAGKYVNIFIPAKNNKESLLTKIKIVAKNINPECHFQISEITLLKGKSIIDGLDFETNSSCGKWSLWNSASFQISNEYAFCSKKSLRMSFSGKSGIIFHPTINDWSKYKELRFTLSNPLPRPNTKYIRLLVNNCYIPATALPRRLHVSPESTKQFKLNLSMLGSKIDIKNIKKLSFLQRRNVETTLYIDNIKLVTAAEIEQEKTSKYKKIISEIKDNIPEQSSYYYKKIKTLLASLQKQCDKKTIVITPALQELLLKAKRLLVIVKMHKSIGSDNPQNSMLLVAAPPTKKIFRDTCFKYSNFPYRLSSAKHERESFQCIIIPKYPLKNVKVSASPLVSESNTADKISASNVTINPVGYVEVTNSFYYPSSRPGWWPDPLIPNQAINIRDRIQPFWITVYVPAKQAAGKYHGKLTIAPENETPQTVNYSIDVKKFRLPLRGSLKTFIDFRYKAANQVIRRKCYSLFLDHRLNPIGMYNRVGSYQPAKEDLAFCLERGLNLISICYFKDTENKKNPFYFNDDYTSKVVKFIKDYKVFLKKNKCWDIAIANGFDEIMRKPDLKNRLAEAKKLCKTLKREIPGIKLANVGDKMAISTKLMDWWFLLKKNDKNKDIWQQGGNVAFYWVYDNPSFMLDLPGIAPRVCVWLAFKYGAKGIGYYSSFRPEVCSFKHAPTGIDWAKNKLDIETLHRHGRNGDGYFIYPYKDGSILSSIRLENIRDGIEDYEYFSLLKKLSNGKKQPLLDIPDSIVGPESNNYTRDYNELNTYRKKIANEIERIINVK